MNRVRVKEIMELQILSGELPYLPLFLRECLAAAGMGEEPGGLVRRW